MSKPHYFWPNSKHVKNHGTACSNFGAGLLFPFCGPLLFSAASVGPCYQQIEVPQGKAIAEKQPADFMAVYKGTPILIECKTTRRKISFPLYYGKSASIPRHQIDYALENEKNGGRSFFLLRKDEARKKRVWAVTPQGVDKMYKKVLNYFWGSD